MRIEAAGCVCVCSICFSYLMLLIAIGNEWPLKARKLSLRHSSTTKLVSNCELAVAATC